MWTPMLTLPNVEVQADIQTSSLAIVSAKDKRIRDIVKAYLT